jgi:hypothetical protein
VAAAWKGFLREKREKSRKKFLRFLGNPPKSARRHCGDAPNLSGENSQTTLRQCRALSGRERRWRGTLFPMTKEEKRAYHASYHAKNSDSAKARSAKWYAANKEKSKLQKREWYIANREKALLRQREWSVLNRELRKATRAKHYAENRDKLIEKSKAWSASNLDKMKSTKLKYRSNNREKIRTYSTTRRARKRNAVIGDTKTITAWERGWKRKKRVHCYWCCLQFIPKKCHTDHIIALARGGEHEVGNLCISCQPCNSRKRDKSVSTWNLALSQPVLL